MALGSYKGNGEDNIMKVIFEDETTVLKVIEPKKKSPVRHGTAIWLKIRKYKSKSRTYKNEVGYIPVIRNKQTNKKVFAIRNENMLFRNGYQK